jgi:outer membrane receptor protein involved in Fe transport
MTLARPEFREISPFSFYDFNTTYTITGFDSLNQTRIHNADLRYEYFFGKGQMAAVSLYYKYFIDPIEQVVTLKGADYTLFSFHNAKSASNGGIEIEFRKNLDFLGKNKHLEDFMFSGNFSYIYSKIDLSGISGTTGAASRPLQGQSPFVINAGFTYKQPKLDLSFTLLYNQAGRRLAVVGTTDYADMYESSRPLLDFQVSKRVFKNGVVKLTFGDLIAKSTYFYQNAGKTNTNFQKKFDTVLIEQKNQRTYTLSFTYTFK